MDHFNYDDYKTFINFLIENQDRSRGEYTRIAASLGVSTVLISQIFKGEKDLTSEQGLKLTQYFGFTELQTKYFLTCISFIRAGDLNLKNYYKRELEEIRLRSQQISERVTSNQELDDTQKAIYYSSWTYSAIHLACALPFINNEEEISQLLKSNKDQVHEAVKFLLETGLLKKESGDLKIGTTHIHLDKSSPYIAQHHKNWRLFSSQKSSYISAGEMMYTAPMVISRKIAADLHLKLLELIQDMVKTTVGCPDEELWNLNVDFVRMI